MQVTAWIDYQEVEDGKYQDILDEEWEEATAALIKHIRDNNNPISGFEHQQGPEGVPLFDNGKVLACSFRTWGGLMYKALHPDGDDPMGYCDWAWIRPTSEEKELWPADAGSDEPDVEKKPDS